MFQFGKYYAEMIAAKSVKRGNSKHSPRLSRPLVIALVAVVASTSFWGCASASASPISPEPVTQLPPPSYAEAAASPDWVPTPGGLAYASCVHEVPDGAEISADGIVTVKGVAVKTIPPCPYSGVVPVSRSMPADQNLNNGAIGDGTVTPPSRLTGGWWLYSWWTSSAQITRLSAEWSVPANPASNGALIYLFPSVEASNGSAIVQPVLQWGTSPAGGGNYWAVANWFVPANGTAIHGNLQSASAGQTITGTMSRGSGTSTTWTVTFTNTTAGTWSTMYVDTSGFTSWNAVQGAVLEVYNISSCNQLPNTYALLFRNIAVTSTSGSVTPSFTAYRDVSSCTTSITTTNTSTTLGWKTS